MYTEHKQVWDMLILLTRSFVKLDRIAAMTFATSGTADPTRSRTVPTACFDMSLLKFVSILTCSTSSPSSPLGITGFDGIWLWFGVSLSALLADLGVEVANAWLESPESAWSWGLCFALSFLWGGFGAALIFVEALVERDNPAACSCWGDEFCCVGGSGAFRCSVEVCLGRSGAFLLGCPSEDAVLPDRMDCLCCTSFLFDM